MSEREQRPSERLRGLRGYLYDMQDSLDDLGVLFTALGCPESANRAASAGDAIADLRRAVESDAGRLETREAKRDREAELAVAGGVTPDAIDGVSRHD